MWRIERSRAWRLLGTLSTVQWVVTVVLAAAGGVVGTLTVIVSPILHAPLYLQLFLVLACVVIGGAIAVAVPLTLRPRLARFASIRYQSTEEGASLLVTNKGPTARFRARIQGITGSNGAERRHPDPDPFPWDVGWGDENSAECELPRGDTARLNLVTFDFQACAQIWGGQLRRDGGNPYPFLFSGPSGDHGLWALMYRDTPESEISVELWISRLGIGGVQRETLAVALPFHPLWWEHSYDSRLSGA